ncbi:LysR family transcriptional regulator [Sphingomonas flavalba]|uniref:LysR family transcriptional regulator n=1 Tax=Sphingomonas flavalba TaxID=2559804 RepID=UPI0039E0BD17
MTDVAHTVLSHKVVPGSIEHCARVSTPNPIDCAETPMLSTEHLAAFLAVMRNGNAIGAARRLGVDHSTVTRRLDALEKSLNVRLFDRSPRGFAPTDAAGLLLIEAERVERALLNAASIVADRSADVSGTVRLATPEIFGTALVAPHVARLTRDHPGILLELVPESRSFSLSRREADIAIMVRKPPRGRLVTRRLADYTVALYAAESYLAAHPPIQKAEDLRDHAFVSFVEELAPFPELVALDQLVPFARIAFRSSSSLAQQAAVKAGVGIGALHRLAADDDPGLVRVLPELAVQRSYWLVVHADLRRLPAVRAVIAFLESIVILQSGRL